MAPTDDSATIDTALAKLDARRVGYTTYRNYYSGAHPPLVAPDKTRSAFGAFYDPGPDNLCAAVVDALVERLELTGFSVEGRATEGKPEVDRPRDAGDDAWDLWNANRMDLRAGEVHLGAVRDGDAYVIVWDDPRRPGTPVIHPNPADLVTVVYDDEMPGRIVVAVKRWTRKDGKTRVNVYYPDRIEKYVSRTTTAPARLSLYERAEDDVLNPYGVVPVFHFANNAPIGMFGVSELVNAIPSQRRLNKTLADLDIAREIVALVQRWVSGVEIPIDPLTGKPADLKLAWERLLIMADPQARAGTMQGADLSSFFRAIDDARLSIARNTGTPLHYMLLQNDPPSGKALQTLEARFVKKCRARQTAFGNTWEDAMALALLIAGRGDDTIRLSAQWANPAPTDAKAEAETAEIKARIGVPREQLLKELGYTDKQIATWQAQTGRRGRGDAAGLLAALEEQERARRLVDEVLP